VRSSLTRPSCLCGGAFCRRRYCHCILVRFRHVLRWWTHCLAPAYRCTDDLCRNRYCFSFGTPGVTPLALQARPVDVLCTVYDKQPTDEYIISERDAIRAAIQLETSDNNRLSSFMSVFRNDHVKTRRRVFLAWWVQFMNQAGGINLVVYYAPCKLRRSPISIVSGPTNPFDPQPFSSKMLACHKN
jgi:hypothetical protein